MPAPENAPLLIVVTDSGIDISLSLIHPLKADLEMVVHALPIIHLSNEVHPIKF